MKFSSGFLVLPKYLTEVLVAHGASGARPPRTFLEPARRCPSVPRACRVQGSLHIHSHQHTAAEKKRDWAAMVSEAPVDEGFQMLLGRDLFV